MPAVFQVLLQVLTGGLASADAIALHPCILEWFEQWRSYNVGGRVSGQTLRQARVVCSWIIQFLAIESGTAQSVAIEVQSGQTPVWTTMDVHDYLFEALEARERVNGGVSLFLPATPPPTETPTDVGNGINFVGKPHLAARADAIAAVADLVWVAAVVKGAHANETECIAQHCVDFSNTAQKTGANPNSVESFVRSMERSARQHLKVAPRGFVMSTRSGRTAALNGTTDFQAGTGIVCGYSTAEATAVQTAFRAALEEGGGSFRRCCELYFYLAAPTGQSGPAAVPDGLRQLGPALFHDSHRVANEKFPLSRSAKQHADSSAPAWRQRLQLHPMWSRPFAGFFISAPGSRTFNELRNLFLLDDTDVAASALPEYFHMQSWETKTAVVPEASQHDHRNFARNGAHTINRARPRLSAPVAVSLLCAGLHPFVDANDVLRACFAPPLYNALLQAAGKFAGDSVSIPEALEDLVAALLEFIIPGFTASLSAHGSSDVTNTLTQSDRLRLIEAAFRYLDFRLQHHSTASGDAGIGKPCGPMLIRRCWILLKTCLPLVAFRCEQRVNASPLRRSIPHDILSHARAGEAAEHDHRTDGSNNFSLQCHTPPIDHISALLGCDLPSPQAGFRWCWDVCEFVSYAPGLYACLRALMSHANPEQLLDSHGVAGSQGEFNLESLAARGLAAAWNAKRPAWFSDIVRLFFAAVSRDSRCAPAHDTPSGNAFDSHNAAKLVALLRTLHGRLCAPVASSVGDMCCVKNSAEFSGVAHAFIAACLPFVDTARFAMCLLANETSASQPVNADNTPSLTIVDLLPVAALADLSQAVELQQSWLPLMGALRQSIRAHVQSSQIDRLTKAVGARERMLIIFLQKYGRTKAGLEMASFGRSTTRRRQAQQPVSLEWLAFARDFLQCAGADTDDGHVEAFARSASALLPLLLPPLESDGNADVDVPTAVGPQAARSTRPLPTNVDWPVVHRYLLGGFETSSVSSATDSGLDEWEGHKRHWGLQVDLWAKSRQQAGVHGAGDEDVVAESDLVQPPVVSDLCGFCGSSLVPCGSESVSEAGEATEEMIIRDSTLVAYDCAHCYHEECDPGFCFQCTEKE